MTQIVTAAQMRAIETTAIQSGAATSGALIERAGAAVIEEIDREWPRFSERVHYATVLCGPGRTGGAGYVAARLLAERGWFVEVYYYGDPDALPAEVHARYLRAADVVQMIAPMTNGLGDGMFETDTQLIIDAGFGTGLSRPLDELAGDVLAGEIAICAEHDLGPKCVAIDIPSGLSPDDGLVLERPPFKEAFRAQLTVALHRKKWGHVTGDGPAYCGKVVVADMGL